MLKQLHLENQFVRHLPDELCAGILYISVEYGTASHLCCCGCGEEVVTPFAPAQWRMTFDGEAVSLHPSIGNWLLKCRSHYVIKNGRVIEAEPWSEAQVAAGLANDRAARGRMYKHASPAPQPAAQVIEALPVSPGPLRRIWSWLSGQ